MKLVALEIIFLMRNKRTRVLFFLNYFFLIMAFTYSYNYFSDSNPSFTSRILMIGWLFVCLNGFIFFPLKTFSFASTYLVSLLSKPQIMKDFFKKRYIFYVLYSSFFFVQLLIAIYYFSPDLKLHALAFFLYAIGFNLPFSLFASLWNTEDIPLNELGGKYNLSLIDNFWYIPIIPLLLLRNFEFQILIIMCLLGAIGIVSFPIWSKYLTQQLSRKKYQILRIAL